MGLIPKSGGWNAMQVTINSTTILPEPAQRERLAQVREESALVVLSRRIERIKDVNCPSLDCQETICGLFY